MSDSTSDSNQAPAQDTSVNNQVVIPSSMSAQEATAALEAKPEAPAPPSQPKVTSRPKKSIGKAIAWVIGILILAVIGWLAYANWSELVDLYSKASTPSAQVGAAQTPDRNIEVNPSVTPTPSVKGISDAMAAIPQASTFKAVGQAPSGQTQAQAAAVTQVMGQVTSALQRKDGPALYALLSSQLTSYFTADSVSQAFASSGGAISVKADGEPQFSGEWARQLVDYAHDGTTTNYYVVLHLENGSWKLFGTMPAS